MKRTRDFGDDFINVDDPRYKYELSGYSLKQLFGLFFSGSIGLAFAIGFIYVAYKFIEAVPDDIFSLAATMFIFGIVGIIIAGGGVAMIIALSYIRRPGIQAPGKLGVLEKKLGLD